MPLIVDLDGADFAGVVFDGAVLLLPVGTFDDLVAGFVAGVFVPRGSVVVVREGKG